MNRRVFSSSTFFLLLIFYRLETNWNHLISVNRSWVRSEGILYINVSAMENGFVTLIFSALEPLWLDSALALSMSQEAFGSGCCRQMGWASKCFHMFLCLWMENEYTLHSIHLPYMNTQGSWSSKSLSSHWAVVMTIIFQIWPSWWMRRVWNICFNLVTKIKAR